ncbi:MAG: T9SS type A sorting domain-containing protein [Bacteroidota bacterium]
MKSVQLLTFIFFIFNFTIAQHSIPFASQNNSIELSIANASTVAANNVVVEVTSAPQWLQFQNRKVTIENLSANENKTAHFLFSADKSAPVNKSEQVIFTISNSPPDGRAGNGERWTKTLSLQISPPEKFELFQNYPNPFNPTTTIGYQLPMSSIVSLQIFDAIGREVVMLDEGMKEPGYHQVEWNATNISSGMYIYQVSWNNEKGVQQYYRKKMLITK